MPGLGTALEGPGPTPALPGERRGWPEQGRAEAGRQDARAGEGAAGGGGAEED